MQESASYLLHDGRGSVVQEVVGAASVTSWRRYTAFGEVSAGTDAHEGRFFGYDAEEQSSVTGLVYLRFRHYDPEMGRFGVADTYLGDAFDPITLNRYLYCASDPVNHVDPTGHSSWSLFYSFANRTKIGAAALGAYNNLRQSHLNSAASSVLPFIQSILPPGSGRLTPPKSGSYRRTGRMQSASGMSGGNGSSRSAETIAKQILDMYYRIYCGDAKHMNDSWSQMGVNMHSFADTYFVIPGLGTGADWLAYVSEGNVPMTALYGLLTIADVFTLGGAVVTAKVAIKVATSASRADDVLDIIKASKAVSAAPAVSKTQKVAGEIMEWLGDDARFVRNSSDDVVLLSADATKRVRFDLNHPAQHIYPHMHVEEKIGKDWVKSGPIFPTDILG